MVKDYDLIIIGAGASGLMTAISAGEEKLKILLIEKQEKSGSKLKITGKGRCNITNTAPINDFIEKFGKQGPFLYRAFSVFFSNDLISLFENNGVKCVTERGGRVFPESNKAFDILNVLLKKIRKFKVDTIRETVVQELLIEDNVAVGVLTKNMKTNIGRTYFGKNIVVSTGGLSYPLTGSTGDGYKFAERVGHTVKKTHPSLVGLDISDNSLDRLEGLSLKNVTAKMFVNNKKHSEEFGDMLFTKTGISGPIVLKLSRKYAILDDKSHVKISIDLKPALDFQKLDERIERELKENNRMQLNNILRHLLPKTLVSTCLRLNKLNPNKFANQVNKQERKALCQWLKDFSVEITQSRPIEEAIITAGGVSLKEINPQTMESKKVKNLYFVGEVLDIDADTGGYNLQGAFSTGWLAGKSV